MDIYCEILSPQPQHNCTSKLTRTSPASDPSPFLFRLLELVTVVLDLEVEPEAVDWGVASSGNETSNALGRFRGAITV
jgi:hypothetical protein